MNPFSNRGDHSNPDSTIHVELLYDTRGTTRISGRFYSYAEDSLYKRFRNISLEVRRCHDRIMIRMISSLF